LKTNNKLFIKHFSRTQTVVIYAPRRANLFPPQFVFPGLGSESRVKDNEFKYQPIDLFE